MTEIHVMVYKSQVQKVSFMPSVFFIKFVNFASFICLFGKTHNNNRETLCAFVSYLNLLHQSVMLRPKQPYHKNYSPEMDGRQSAKDHGANY